MVNRPGSSKGAISKKASRLELKRQSSPEKHVPDEAGLNDLGLARLDLIKSLQHTERDVFYSTYWEDICLPALHPIFHLASHLARNNRMLNDAILALSACNLSRIKAEQRNTPRMNQSSLSPSLIHQTRSYWYYSSAIRAFASLQEVDYRYNATVVLTVLAVFAHLESSMGNFKGFYCYFKGLSAFLMDLEEIAGDPVVKSLLTSWMQIRFVVWWARAYFCSLDVLRRLPPVPLPKLLEGSFVNSLYERRVVVLSIMCESHRLNYNAALKHWSSRKESNDWEKRGQYTIHDGNDRFNYYILLAEEARKLDEWLLHLSPSEQPLSIDHNIDDTPIYFQSHDAALNYAYYALARIMQCTDSIRHLSNKMDPYSPERSFEEGPWIRLLLRITKGMNLRISASRNSYTIGFSGLLLAALLRCQDLVLSLEIQNWLQNLESVQPTEEGAFPVYQALGVAKAINRQKMMGRDMFGVTQPVDDHGGTPKVTAYNSQSISTVLLHGRCRVSGELFTECVSIDLHG